MILAGEKAKEVVPQVSELLHLSNLAWTAPKGSSSVMVYAKKQHTRYLLCVLTKQNPQVQVDVYVSKDEHLALQMSGEGEVHITGYYEPQIAEPVKELVAEPVTETVLAVEKKVDKKQKNKAKKLAKKEAKEAVKEVVKAPVKVVEEVKEVEDNDHDLEDLEDLEDEEVMAEEEEDNLDDLEDDEEDLA